MNFQTSKTIHDSATKLLKKSTETGLLSVLKCLMLTVVISLFFDQTHAAAESPTNKKPVLIFLLSGQSNMTGRGDLGDLNKPEAEQQGTLIQYLKAPQNAEKYKSLYSGPNKNSSGWTIRDDVFIIMGSGAEAMHGGLQPGFGGFRNKGFGPELAIGHVLGDHYEEPILLVKLAYGANSLGGNFRPPSSGGQVGDKYPLVVGALRDAITRLPEIVPNYDKSQGYKIAGFFWNQGENDTDEKLAPEYETNLTNLIKDLRKEFEAPDMKTVVAVTGCYGWDLADMMKEIKTQPKKDAAAKWWGMVRDAQLAISKRPEFIGNVASTETRDFWRPREGSKQGIHWNNNGESYWLMGESMGRSMLDLLKVENLQK